MNVPTGQYCPPSIGMVAAFKLESLAGIVGIRKFVLKAFSAAPELAFLAGHLLCSASERPSAPIKTNDHSRGGAEGYSLQKADQRRSLQD